MGCEGSTFIGILFQLRSIRFLCNSIAQHFMNRLRSMNHQGKTFLILQRNSHCLQQSYIFSQPSDLKKEHNTRRLTVRTDAKDQAIYVHRRRCSPPMSFIDRPTAHAHESFNVLDMAASPHSPCSYYGPE